MGHVYEVRVHGVLSTRLLDSLRADTVMRADTVFYGEVLDQAALHGLLARVRDSGLELVDVRQVSPTPTDPPAPSNAPRQNGGTT